MTHQHQQAQEEAPNDLFDALERIHRGVGTAEDAESLMLDPQALQAFYQWSENENQRINC